MGEALSGFKRIVPTERTSPWDWKAHLPEVGAGREKLDTHIRLAVASFANGGYFALDRFAAVFVYDVQFLPDDDGLFHWKKTALAAHRLRAGLYRHFVAGFGVPPHRQAHRQRNAHGAPAFLKSKVQ